MIMWQMTEMSQQKNTQAQINFWRKLSVIMLNQITGYFSVNLVLGIIGIIQMGRSGPTMVPARQGTGTHIK